MAQTKMEILITGDPSEFLKALEQSKAASAAAGTKITSSVKSGAQEAEGAIQQFAGASATAAQSYIKDQRMQGRQANFLAKEILDLGIVGQGAGEMLKGGFGLAIEALGGLREGLSKVAVGLILFEAIKVGVTVFNHFAEAAKKAAEEAKAFGEQVSSSLTKAVDKLTDLRNKSRPDSAQTGDSLDATVRLRDRNVARLGELERELAAINERYLADVASMGEGAGPGPDTRAQASEVKRLTEEISNYKAMVFATIDAQTIQRRSEEAARSASLSESGARGNLDYEMAGGDGGALAVGQKIDLLREKFAQVSAEAAAIIAKARGASEEELERLRLKAQLIGLNAQLTADSTQAEINATRRRIQAAKEESAAKLKGLPQFGPGSIGGDAQFQKDRAAQLEEETRQDELSGKFSGFETPGGLGESDPRIDQAKKDAKDLKEAYTAVGSSVAGVFSSIGSAIGGTAGEFISALGQMLGSVLALIVALATSDTLSTGPQGIFAAIPVAAGILAAVMGMIGGISGRAVGGAVNTGVPYLVGEAGTERFVPSVSGSIVPNGQLGGGGGNVSVVFNAPVDQAWWRANERHIVRTLREASRSGRA